MARLVTKPRLMREATVAARAQGAGAKRASVPPPQRPGARRKAKSRFSAIDGAVVTAGVLAAIASASFAIYMAAARDRPPVFNGIDHLMIFAQPNRGVAQPLLARVSKAPDDQGIDFTATGTIPNEGKTAAPPDHTLPAIHSAERVLPEFTLRGVSGNVAVVEDANDIYRVEIGSPLPGGGRVLAIEWRQGRFVVVTTRGVIREAQP